jgi:hypothetical protein
LTNGTILKPRLDVAFKSTNPNVPRRPIPEKFKVRVHWQRFIDWYSKKHNLAVKEFLLTQITPDLARRYENPYIPHRGQSDGYKAGHFYMQTVFPHIFSVDTKGWGGDCSFLPVGTDEGDAFAEFQKRVELNQSFFLQPDRRKIEPIDIFFVAQLPHDKNVVDQSDIGVAGALSKTLEFARENNLSVTAKGHPLWGSSRYTGQCTWSDLSIHDLIAAAQIVVTVNSGVGMETVLHEKPVYAFGRANYSEISAPSLEAAFSHKPDYEGFFNAWYNAHEDYTRCGV